jgi:hypothetical protein
VGGDDVDGDDVLARPAPAPAVPALPALEQEPAEAHARAVPAREDAPVSVEERRQLGAALDRRAGGGDAGRRVVGHVAQAAEVDQQRVVAHAPRRPAVTAGADGDPQALLAGQPHAGDDVVLVGGQQHGGGKAVGAAGVEHAADARLLVAGLAAAVQRPGEAHTITACPPSTTMSTALR